LTYVTYQSHTALMRASRSVGELIEREDAARSDGNDRETRCEPQITQIAVVMREALADSALGAHTDFGPFALRVSGTRNCLNDLRTL
jgi:hypothetical protein